MFLQNHRGVFPLPNIPLKNKKRETQKLSKDFLAYSAKKASQEMRRRTAHDWEKVGAQRALDLFQAASQRVPAYKDFLRTNGIKSDKIKNSKDFKQVPAIDKENYLRAYPLKDLCWDGKLENADVISVSSGSSGKVFFWPRDTILEYETTYIQELILHDIFKSGEQTTLYIDCFAMGMYIAGPIILNSALRVAQKGYPISVMSPGLSMEDIMRIIPEVGPKYKQIILAGYPPYIKDVLEEAVQQGVNWKKIEVKLLVAGEGFTEAWRDYVMNIIGTNQAHRIINIYGTADASIVGHETPISIALRRLATNDTKLANTLFDNRYPGRVPTVVQYYPTQKYFEEVNDELHFTASSSIPLIRYNIHDDGGIIHFDSAVNRLSEYDYDIDSFFSHQDYWKLPFVYLYGRSDFTVVFYGANIYPENMKEALEKRALQKHITGRFVMSVEEDKERAPNLLIRVELQEGVEPALDLKNKIQSIVLKTLLKVNDEYRSSFHAKGEKAKPIIVLHQKEDSQYFSRKTNKQSWVHKG